MRAAEGSEQLHPVPQQTELSHKEREVMCPRSLAEREHWVQVTCVMQEPGPNQAWGNSLRSAGMPLQQEPKYSMSTDQPGHR